MSVSHVGWILDEEAPDGERTALGLRSRGSAKHGGDITYTLVDTL